MLSVLLVLTIPYFVFCIFRKLIGRTKMKKNEHKLICKGLVSLERLYEWNVIFRISSIMTFPVTVFAFLQITNLDVDSYNIYDFITYALSGIVIYLLLKFVFSTKSILEENVEEFNNRGFLDGHEGWFLGLDITNSKEREYH